MTPFIWQVLNRQIYRDRKWATDWLRKWETTASGYGIFLFYSKKF